MMRHLVVAFAVALTALIGTSPAVAERTVIDGGGQLTLSGYCDTDGTGCVPVDLGYGVNFGSGVLTKVLIYGNGILTFGPTVAKFSDYMGNFANYGVPVVSAGVNPDTGADSFGHVSLYQSAKLTIGATGALTARYYYCQGPTNCADNYILTLTPGAGGYTDNIQYFNLPVVKINGYSIPGVTNQNFFTLPTTFFIPAVFSSAVPEPRSWMLMILGFGLIGGWLRRARQRQPIPAVN